MPADQGFHTKHFARAESYFRLVVETEFIILHARTHVFFNFKSLNGVLTEIGRILTGARATLRLGAIHRHVSIGQQCRHIGPIYRKGGDADTSGDFDLVALKLGRLTDGREDFCRQHPKTFFVTDRFDHHDEFVASQTRHQITVANARTQATGHFPQQLITGRMAECVVDGLEIVQINEKYCQSVLIAFSLVQGLLEGIAQ